MAPAAVTDRPGTPTGRADLFRALGVLAEQPGPAHDRLAGMLDLPVPTRSDWTEAFVVHLVPYASIYLGPDGMLGGEAADRVAGFWRALRLRVPSEPDHLTSLLGLYATLLEAERDEDDPARRLMRRQARTALLHEHLLSWLLPYAHAMTDVGPEPYARWAGLLAETVRAEVREVGVPERLPSHLRDVPAMPGTDADLAGLLTALLSPARSGIVLSRGHLAVAARRRSLGLRLGDRQRMLRTLLEQDHDAAFAELADQAGEWMRRHRTDEPVAGPIARHWTGRAAATADLLTIGRLQATDQTWQPVPTSTTQPPTRQEESR